jgi:hypothetical protein
MIIRPDSIAGSAPILVLSFRDSGISVHPAGSVGHSRLSMEVAAGSVGHSRLSMELATRSVGDTRLSMVVATCAWNFSPPRIVFLHGSLYTLLLIMETRQRCRRLTMREEPVIAA